MPTIQFDILIPDTPPQAATDVAAAFIRAVNILEKRGMLSNGHVDHIPGQQCPDDTVAQLCGVYRDERGEDPDAASMHRIIVTADDVRSYNQLAMGLSRILTPKADLPRDPVALERETEFEQPSIYPWTVEILR